MFHPVGHQSPSVYWRRRLVFLASAAVLVVLIAVTVRAFTSGDDPAAAVGPSGSTSPSTTASARTVATPSTRTTTTPKARTSTKKHAASTSVTKSTPPPPAACALAKLAVSAAVAKTSYKVGEKPVVELLVTNTGTAPCVQDLADKQVELKIYNGESRVWGSHDCEIQPGTNLRTLPVGSSVRVQITWSGLTSQPKCAGTRQRAAAGSYTLYAALAGKTGKVAQFAIS